MDFSYVFDIQDILRDRQELFFEKRVPKEPACVDESRPMIPQILEKDMLLSYPYESIKPFLRLLHEAANDKNVLSIRMTLYRLAKNSKIVEALVKAAENGKQDEVLVELKARFAEENNIGWCRQLAEAGCHVVYGIDGLKVHSKLCLITVKSDDGIQYITQIGTGNYNEKTARLYTDLSLMTANYEIGDEARKTFQEILIGNTIDRTEHLLVAPNSLQQPVLDMIQGEIEHAKKGEASYIGIKVNSLTDKKIMDKLTEASKAGVHIDMVVRGICCLIPGVEGETENIPHAPGGQEPSSPPDLPDVIPGFVIYYDTDRYVMTEEDGVTYIRFELPEEYPPCEMEIRHVPNTTAAAAIAAARTEALADARWQTVSEIGPVETPAGLHFSVCSGNQWDSAWENVYFVSDGKNGCFRIISRYFVEAAEGHGARFAAMLQTFEVVAG